MLFNVITGGTGEGRRGTDARSGIEQRAFGTLDPTALAPLRLYIHTTLIQLTLLRYFSSFFMLACSHIASLQTATVLYTQPETTVKPGFHPNAIACDGCQCFDRTSYWLQVAANRMLGRSSGNHDWLCKRLRLARFPSKRNARNAQAIAFGWKPGLTLPLARSTGRR